MLSSASTPGFVNTQCEAAAGRAADFMSNSGMQRRPHHDLSKNRQIHNALHKRTPRIHDFRHAITTNHQPHGYHLPRSGLIRWHPIPTKASGNQPSAEQPARMTPLTGGSLLPGPEPPWRLGAPVHNQKELETVGSLSDSHSTDERGAVFRATAPRGHFLRYPPGPRRPVSRPRSHGTAIIRVPFQLHARTTPR